MLWPGSASPKLKATSPSAARGVSVSVVALRGAAGSLTVMRALPDSVRRTRLFAVEPMLPCAVRAGGKNRTSWSRVSLPLVEATCTLRC